MISFTVMIASFLGLQTKAGLYQKRSNASKGEDVQRPKPGLSADYADYTDSGIKTKETRCPRSFNTFARLILNMCNRRNLLMIPDVWTLDFGPWTCLHGALHS